MSRDVTTHVTEMVFDNQQFESGVKTSLNTIQTLKKALKFDNNSDALKGISSALGGVNDSVNNSKTTILDFFKSFNDGTIGAVAKIRLISDAVKKLEGLAGQAYGAVKSITLDQIDAGMSKYEQETNAVQTILAATKEQNKSLDDVYKTLDKVAWYADETSYAYTDMVSSIGTFTAAGLGLEESATAMMGIANWAAASGVNAKKAAGAFKNVTDAISAGKMRLEDWRSIEKINMNTQEFKKTAIETAVSLGKLKQISEDTYEVVGKKGVVSVNNFNDALKDDWFNTETIMKTLTTYGAYTDAVYEVKDAYSTCAEAMEHVNAEGMELSANAFKMGQEAKTFTDAIEATKDAVSSQWSKTFRLVFGNLEEATELWSNFTGILWDIFASGGDKRNNILEKWYEFGGRTELIDAISTAFGHLRDVLDALFPSLEGEARTKYFEVMGQKLADASKKFREFVDQMGLTDEALEVVSQKAAYLRDAFSKVKDVIGAGLQKIASIVAFTLKLISALNNYAIVHFDGLRTGATSLIKTLPTLESFKDKIKKISDLFGASDWLERAKGAFAGLVDSMKNADKGSVLNNLYTKLKEIKELGPAGIGQSIRDGIFNKLSNFKMPTFEGFYNGLAKMKTHLVAFVDYAKNLPIVGNILTALSRVLNLAKNKLSGLKGVLKNVVDELANKDLKGAMDSLKTILSGKLNDLLTTIKNFGEKVKTNGVSAFTDLFKSVKGKFNDFINFVKGLFSKENNPLDALNLTGVKANAGEATKGLKERFDGLDTIFKNLNDSIQELGGSFATLVKPIFDFVEAIGASNLAVIVFGIAISSSIKSTAKAATEWSKNFATIGTAIDKFNPLAPFKDLIASAKGMFDGVKGITTSVSDLVKTLNKNVKSNNFLKVALGITAIALSLKLLAGTKWEDLWPSVAAVAALGAVVAGITAILGSFAKNGGPEVFNGAALAIIEIAASMLLIAFAVDKISKIEGNLVQGGVTCGIFLAAMTGMAVVFSKLGPTMATGSRAVLGFSLALVVLSFTMKSLEKIGAANLSHVVPIIAELAGIFIMVGYAGKIAKDNTSTAALGFLAFSGTLYILSGAIKKINKIGVSNVQNAMKVLVEMVGLFAITEAISRIPGNALAKSGLTFASFAVGVYIMLGAVKRINKIGAKEAYKATGVILAFGGIFMAMEALSKYTAMANGAGKVGAAFLGFSAGVVVLSAAVKILGKIPMKELGKATLIIGAFALMFDSMLLVSGKAAAIKAGVFTGFAASVSVLMISLGALAILDDDALMRAVEGVTKVFLSIAAMMATASLITNAWGTLNLAIIAGAIAGIAYAIWYFQISIPLETVEAVKKIADSLTETLLGLGIIAAVLSAIHPDLKTGSQAALVLLEFVAVAVVIVAVVGALMELLTEKFGSDRIEGALNGVVAVFDTIGRAIGAFVGGIVTEIGNAATEIKSNRAIEGSRILGEFSENVAAVLPTLAAYDDKSVANVENFVMVYQLLSEGLTGLGLVITDDQIKFSEKFKIFAYNIAVGLKNVKDLKVENVSAVADITKSLKSMMDGITDPLIFEKFLELAGNENFTKALVSYGANMQAFSDSLGHFKAEPVVAASESLSVLVNGFNEIAGTGVVGQIGNGSMDGFFSKLEFIGESMKKYYNQVLAVSPGVVEKSTAAFAAVVELAKDVPNSGGLIELLVGDNDIEKFGEGLNKFGAAFSRYAFVVGAVDNSVYEKTQLITNSLVDMATKLPNSGGALGDIFGNNDIGTFGENLSVFGTKFKVYALAVSGVDNSVVEKTGLICDSLKKVVSVAKDIPNDGGVAGFLAGNNGIDQFGAQIKAFSEDMAMFTDNIELFDTTKLDDYIANVQKIIDFARSIEPNDVFVLGDMSNQLNQIDQSWLNKLVSSIFASADQFTELGQTIITNIATGFDAGMEPAKETMSMTFEILYSEAETWGTELANHYALGATSETAITNLKNASEKMATAIAEYIHFSYQPNDPLNGVYGEYQEHMGEAFAENASAADPGLNEASEHFAEEIALDDEQVKKVGESGSGIPKAIADEIGDAVPDVKDDVKDFIEDLVPDEINKDVVVNVDPVVSLKSAFSGLLKGDTKTLKTFVDQNTNVIKHPIETAKNAVDNAVKNVEEGAKNAANTVVENATKGACGASKETKKLFDVVKDGGKVIDAFFAKYVAGMENLEDVEKIKMSQDAISEWAEAHWKASLTAEEALEAAKMSTKDKLAAIRESFMKTYESIKSSVSNSIKIFDKWEDKQAMSKDTLLENMRSQIKGVKEWSANLTKLAEKGVSEKLIEKFASEGTASADKVGAFLQMSAEEIQEANSLFAESIVLPDQLAPQIMAGMAYAGKMVSEGFKEGVETNKSVAVDASKQMASDVNQGVNEEFGIHSPSEVFAMMAMYCILGFIQGLNEWEPVVLERATALANLIYTAFEWTLRKDKFVEIGVNIGEGLIEGIESKIDEAYDAGFALGHASAEGVAAGAETASPSKATYRTGKFIDMGLINGIKALSSKVYTAAEHVGDDAITGIQNAVAKVAETVDAGLDTTPTIRPVLDMSNMDDGLTYLNNMFAGNRPMDFSVSAKKANSISDALSDAEDKKEAETNTNSNSGMTFIQNNYSPKALSRVEIYRQTKNQFSRMKGAVSGT